MLRLRCSPVLKALGMKGERSSVLFSCMLSAGKNDFVLILQRWVW